MEQELCLPFRSRQGLSVPFIFTVHKHYHALAGVIHAQRIGGGLGPAQVRIGRELDNGGQVRSFRVRSGTHWK